jgi:hypothetical protein
VTVSAPMRQTMQSYRALPPATRVVVGVGVVVAAIVVAANAPNILGAILAIVVVLVVLALVLGVLALPFVVAVLAVYGLVKALRPGPAAAGAAAAGAAPVGPPTAQALPSQPAAAPPGAQAPAELPPEIAARAARVRDRAIALRSADGARYLGAEDQELIERTLSQYLPGCLATYQALPRSATSQPMEAGGKTADQLVADQLRLLEESLDRVAQRVFEAGAAQLVAQQRFLEERLRPE